jgi:hypothetical protein
MIVKRSPFQGLREIFSNFSKSSGKNKKIDTNWI